MTKVLLVCGVVWSLGCSSSEKANRTHQTAADESLRNQLASNEARGRFLSDSKEGFAEWDASNKEGQSFESIIISSMISPPTYESQLTIRFTCDFKDSIVPLFPRYKSIIWSFLDQSVQSKFRQGEVQTDHEGMARISFSSPDSLYGKQVEIKIGNSRTEVKLGSGPYQVSIDEVGCLNAR